MGHRGLCSSAAKYKIASPLFDMNAHYYDPFEHKPTVYDVGVVERAFVALTPTVEETSPEPDREGLTSGVRGSVRGPHLYK